MNRSKAERQTSSWIVDTYINEPREKSTRFRSLVQLLATRLVPTLMANTPRHNLSHAGRPRERPLRRGDLLLPMPCAAPGSRCDRGNRRGLPAAVGPQRAGFDTSRGGEKQQWQFFGGAGFLI